MQVHAVPTQDGTSAALHVLSRLLEFDHEEDDELWLLLDTDHYTKGTHLASFLKAVGEAKRQGVNTALSKPCFELWLLLHHLNESEIGSPSNAQDVESALRGVLGNYNKSNLKREDYPLKSVADACFAGREIRCGSWRR